MSVMALLQKLKEKLGFGNGSAERESVETEVTVERESEPAVDAAVSEGDDGADDAETDDAESDDAESDDAEPVAAGTEAAASTESLVDEEAATDDEATATDDEAGGGHSS